MSGQFNSPHPFLVLIGAPGSGKSTWARRYFSRQEIVSSDRLRARIGDHSGDQRANPYAFTALHAIVRGRTELGKTVVVDATNRDPEDREKVIAPAIGWCRPAIAVVFLTPLEVCLERNARRRKPRHVPEDWLRETHAMIERDFDPAETWIPGRFNGGVLFVRHEGHGYAGGMINGPRFAQSDWMDCAREDPPEWWHSPDRYPRFHSSAWELRARRERVRGAPA